MGDILHESYGYGMTINKFYEVIALSPSGKTCAIQPIRKITIKGDAYSPVWLRSGAPDRGRGSFLWRTAARIASPENQTVRNTATMFSHNASRSVVRSPQNRRSNCNSSTIRKDFPDGGQET